MGGKWNYNLQGFILRFKALNPDCSAAYASKFRPPSRISNINFILDKLNEELVSSRVTSRPFCMHRHSNVFCVEKSMGDSYRVTVDCSKIDS